MSYMPTNFPESPQAMSVPQLHLKAAEFLEHASRLHREVASLHEAGEARAADLQVLMAHYLVTKVAAHMAEAGKQVRLVEASPDSGWAPPAYGRPFDLNTADTAAPQLPR